MVRRIGEKYSLYEQMGIKENRMAAVSIAESSVQHAKRR